MDRSGKAFGFAWVRRTECICARQPWNEPKKVQPVWRAPLLLNAKEAGATARREERDTCH